MHSNYFYKLINATTSDSGETSPSSLPFPFPPNKKIEKISFHSLPNMPTNHLPMEFPAAWSWKLPMDQYTAKYFPQQQQQQQQQQQLQQLLLQQREGNCEREHMFEKPLTPSDVGKLNRLVIPKQHAEKYFPLDGDSGEKGLLLSFEDESGKAWRFRYSYWTSSQSYVLTKGWSRFVKEKRLDAGDTVLFERRRPSGDLLYIGWKRREVQDNGAAPAHASNAAVPWNPTPVFYAAAPQPYPPNPFHDSSYVYIGAVQQDCLLDAGEQAGLMQNPTRTPPPAPAATTNSKRLRLFGVNLDCGPDQHPEEHGPSSSCLAGQGRTRWFMPSSGSCSQLD